MEHVLLALSSSCNLSQSAHMRLISLEESLERGSLKQVSAVELFYVDASAHHASAKHRSFKQNQRTTKLRHTRQSCQSINKEVLRLIDQAIWDVTSTADASRRAQLCSSRVEARLATQGTP